MQESLAEWARDGIWIRGEASPAGAQDAQVDLGGKERDVETVGRDGIAGGAGDPIDEALEAQSTQVVAHATRCVRGWVETEEPAIRGRRSRLRKPPGRWAKLHRPWKSAITRASPNRRPGARVLPSRVECCSRSNASWLRTQDPVMRSTSRSLRLTCSPAARRY